MLKQAGQFANSPMMDPSKNEGMANMINDGYDQLNGNTEGEPPTEGGEETPPEG